MKEITVSPEKIARQREYCRLAEELLLKRFGRCPVACAVTFGCQQNEADTELLKGMLAEMGFSFTDKTTYADLIVFNTCAIREHAEMRALGNVGQSSHVKRSNSDTIICLCGCMAQEKGVAERVKNSYPYVDIFFGTHALYRFPELLCEKLQKGGRVFDTDGEGVIIEGIEPIRKEPPNAWLSIMYGCNNFCSYCIVPYVRGRERSRDPEIIINELKALVEKGYKDITLLGQNVNSYGNDSGSIDFSELLKRADAVDGDFRLRFMTSHPKDASPKLFDTIASSRHICRSIHLPVQSGSDRILKLMNRKYDVKKYLELVDYARSVVPDISMTSDVIVGFPGETDEDFNETIELIKRVRFDSLFTFIYSKRIGTKAAEMDDFTSAEEKQIRFDRLLEVQNGISRSINESFVEKRVRVLIDGKSEDKNYDFKGRTDGFKLVHIKNDSLKIGEYYDITIDRASTWALFGR